MMHIFLLSLLAWLGQAGEPLNRFSTTSAQMQAFAHKCVQIPTDPQIRKEIHDWSQRDKKSGRPLLKVRLDGFLFEKIGEEEFKALRNLTIIRGAHGGLKKIFRFQMTTTADRTNIDRFCLSERCGAGATEKKFDLTKYQKDNACTDAICGAEKIFGPDKGPLILWSYMKWGTNLSPLSDSMADPQGLDRETLRAIIAASQLVPEHLKNVSLKNTGFYRYLKGSKPALYNNQVVVANSFGGVFDPIDSMSFEEKIYFFLHELAHRARLQGTPALDESPEWMRASGWATPATPPASSSQISKYARVNPFEDFAETYALYRLDSSRLKKISPDRYDFMKKKVFDEIEYASNPCLGSKSSVALSARNSNP